MFRSIIHPTSPDDKLALWAVQSVTLPIDANKCVVDDNGYMKVYGTSLEAEKLAATLNLRDGQSWIIAPFRIEYD